ncbi:hypothetical protein CR513_37583, partial [Mucuna pruriens]
MSEALLEAKGQNREFPKTQFTKESPENPILLAGKTEPLKRLCYLKQKQGRSEQEFSPAKEKSRRYNAKTQ